MKKLKIAILWHQHQPYYRLDEVFVLPWARLHAVKDYLDLPMLLHEFPKVKQTFNLAPSLLLQIEEYLNGEAKDHVQILTELDAAELTTEHKRRLLDSFFTCNFDNMIAPYPRYRYLYDCSRDADYAVNNFTSRDWLDLQVWYNLTWIGVLSRQNPAVKRLFAKGESYTEAEKRFVVEAHDEIMSRIIPEMKLLNEFGQIEISCSPMFHPILPLLCDSRAVLDAMPGAALPETMFNRPEDAAAQMKMGMDYYEKCFDTPPQGVWPSEGSLSNQTLNILSDLGVKWTASDEKLLQSALGAGFSHTMKYYPHKFKTSAGDISILFRDHYLSDKIGFVYSGKDPYEAACDFMQTLINIKNDISYNLGENELDNTAIPIILDGENCWEFYKNNGVDFLRELFKQLSESAEIETITCSETAALASDSHVLSAVKAGSWINADFSIWAGHEEDRKAWSALSEARNAFELIKDSLAPELRDAIQYEFYIAEGSDWFWWYGPEFNAPNKADFDVIFRKRLVNIYNLMKITAPDKLNYPIGATAPSSAITQAKHRLAPQICGKSSSEQEWESAGILDAKGSFSTMRQIGEIIDKIKFCNDDTYLYLRVYTSAAINPEDKIEIYIDSAKRIKITYSGARGFAISAYDKSLSGVKFASGDLIDIAISNCYDIKGDKQEISLTVKTYSGDLQINYPQSGYWGIKLAE